MKFQIIYWPYLQSSLDNFIRKYRFVNCHFHRMYILMTTSKNCTGNLQSYYLVKAIGKNLGLCPHNNSFLFLALLLILEPSWQIQQWLKTLPQGWYYLSFVDLNMSKIITHCLFSSGKKYLLTWLYYKKRYLCQIGLWYTHKQKICRWHSSSHPW